MAKAKRRNGPATRDDRIHVRNGTASDIPAVIALDAQVTGLAKPEFWQSLFDERGMRRSDQRYFLIAEPPEGGRLLGFIIGEVRAWEFGSPPCGWVFALSVDPRSRLGGIGSRLLDAIEARFRQIGVQRMRTMLARDNHLIMSFFRSQGMMAGPYIQLEKELD
jgi:GNAT superfamily N-acetyltransferase